MLAQDAGDVADELVRRRIRVVRVVGMPVDPVPARRRDRVLRPRAGVRLQERVLVRDDVPVDLQAARDERLLPGKTRRVGRRPRPVFQRSRQPDSASRNSKPLTGGRKSGSSTIGMSAIQPFRRYSPSVIASIPALSWSAIASSTARSSAARSSSASIVPARAASSPPAGTRVAAGCRRRPLAPPSSPSWSPSASSRRWARPTEPIGSGNACGTSKARSPSSPEAGAESGSAWPRRSSRRRHEGRDRRRPRRPPRGSDGGARRGRARDPAGRDRPRGVRARRGRDRARPRERPRPLPERRDQPLQRHHRGHVPGLGLGARRQPRRRRQRRGHVRAEDQGARGGRARRHHGVDGRVRRRPGRGDLHDGEVRGARAVGCAALEPAAARDRRLDGLPGPRQEQDLRERPDPAPGALDRRDTRRPGVHAHPPGPARGRDGPEEVGEKVLRAIRRNDFYVFTHPDHRDELRGSSTRSLAAFPDEPVPPDGSRSRRAGAPRRPAPSPRGRATEGRRGHGGRGARPRSSPVARAGSGSAWRRRSSRRG